MNYTLKEKEWGAIFDTVLNTTSLYIKNNGRKKINERFYHHQFSSYLYKYFLKQNVNIWEENLVYPEAKTEKSFNWSRINIKKHEETRKNAIGHGRKGNLDFRIIQTRNHPIDLEWKGPDIYSKIDIIKVALKLFSTQPTTTKIFSAIITSAEIATERHLLTIYNHFKEGLEFALEVLEINPNELPEFYVYVATISETSIIKCHWGKFNDLKINFTNNTVPR